MGIEVPKVWELIQRGENAAIFLYDEKIEVYMSKDKDVYLSCVDVEGDNTSVHICDLDKFAIDVAELRAIYFT